MDLYGKIYGKNSTMGILPTVESVGETAEALRKLVLAEYFYTREEFPEKLLEAKEKLEEVISGVLPDAKTKTEEYFDRLPKLREIIDTDIEAAYSGDPAATGKEVIVAVYPGFFAICVYRLAHLLDEVGVPTVPRMMTEYAHSKTGIDIHPKAVIGKSFFIDHGTGVVIGETTEIGSFVKLYQGVTLGALSTRKVELLRGKKRHPTIMDNVTIYANATILGGETVIGENAVIGGGTFITRSVSKNGRVSVCGTPTD